MEGTPPKLFISYAHEDEAWKDLFVKHLKVLELEGLFEVWADEQIAGGDEWLAKIKEAIDSCSLALLLVSADFLISEFIRGIEVPELLKKKREKGVRIYPALCRPCPWEGVEWLEQMLVRPRGARALSDISESEMEQALADIALEVRSLLACSRLVRDGQCFIQPPEKISTGKLPTTGPDLFGRDEELDELDRAWNDDKTNVIGFHAWGGVGKSALVNAWLAQRMQPDNWRGAERVLGWSFYSQGASEGKQVAADQFIAFALDWFGDKDPTQGSAWDKGHRLADLVRKQRTLLILDGLEPLQNPPGVEPFRIKDPALLCLLKSLAADNQGLCVVTTRFKVPDLDTWARTTVQIEELTRLPSQAGVELLKSLEVRGEVKDLGDAVEDLKGHALALTLLGSLLRVEHDGDIRKRTELPLLEHDEEKGGHARRVIEAYERVFEGKPELDILRMLGLFDRPAPLGAINALRSHPTISGITDTVLDLSEHNWNQALRHLRDAGLLAAAAEAGDLDCHPLIREHFGEKLQAESPESWKEANRRLYEYYKSVPKKSRPDTLEEMAPLFAAIAHGCQAELYQEAFDEVYWRRIVREGEFYDTRELGAFGADLAVISSFFEEQWTKPAAQLKAKDRAWLQNQAGFCLQSLGRPRDALKPMKAALEARLEQEDWQEASTSGGNLSELRLTLGEVDSAEVLARDSLECADKSDEPRLRMLRRATLALALSCAGKVDEARDLFDQAEAAQKECQPEHPLLQSRRAYRYCDLLLRKGEYSEVKERAGLTLGWAEQQHWLLDIALSHLSLGSACLLEAEATGECHLLQAENHLTKAVDGVRASGREDYVPFALLARAHLRRFKTDFEAAKRDIDAAFEIATRGEMRLHEADCHLEYARLYLAQGDKPTARERLDTARSMIAKMGYHRRDEAVEQLDRRLSEK